MAKSEYVKLKEQIIINASSSPQHGDVLKTLKLIFEDDINSVRRLEHIGTVGQLLKVLELRDVISEENIAPLREIAKRLSNSGDLLQKLNEYEENQIRSIRQPSGSNNDSKSTTSKETETESPLLHNPVGGSISKKKLQRIHDTITEEIGTNWRTLARKLKIREHSINQIDNDNRSLPEKASAVLKVFENQADPQKWFFVLCDALERSHRQDIATIISDIMVMNI